MSKALHTMLDVDRLYIDTMLAIEHANSLWQKLLCRHERWQETYSGVVCPDCGKEF
jgi:hypothetical protein